MSREDETRGQGGGPGGGVDIDALLAQEAALESDSPSPSGSPSHPIFDLTPEQVAKIGSPGAGPSSVQLTPEQTEGLTPKQVAKLKMTLYQRARRQRMRTIGVKGLRQLKRIFPPKPPKAPKLSKEAQASQVVEKRTATGKTQVRKLPAWARELLPPARFKVIKGGRGGAKSHTVAEIQIMLQVQNPNRRVVFLREVQKSIKDSVKRLLEDKIKDMGLEKHFIIRNAEIRMTNGTGIMLFQGLADQTAVSIKSLEGMDCAVLEEAHVISKRSIRILFPTIREEGSEIWALYNPENDDDPIHAMFCSAEGPPGGSVVIKASYEDNPHASETMKAQAVQDLKDDPETWDHVWGGETQKHAEARIFKKIRREAFDTPVSILDLGGLRFGLDWGFSLDPLVCLRGFVDHRERKIYIEYEASQKECEIEDTPHLLDQIPAIRRWYITAGRDRPERIKSLSRHGFKVKAAMSGNNSVIEGVEYLQNFEIIIHPRCEDTWYGFKNYKHPIDKLTGAVLPVLPTKKNDFVEAARYMIEDIRRAEQGKSVRSFTPSPIAHRWKNRHA